MEKDLIIQNSRQIANIEEEAMSVENVVHQVALIQQVMVRIMKEDEHYGIIPGTDKPTLYKSGAEKLSMTFRFAPRYEIERLELIKDHREYEVMCHLSSINTGAFMGSGTGNCNTLESRYRYRSENTGKPVPTEYWKDRDSILLGGPQYKARKRDNQWLIFEQIEYDNPADYYNTVKKMAKKRAFVDAILTVTAASDIFSQEDVEDKDSEIKNGDPKPDKKSSKKGKKEPLTDKQRKRLWAITKEKNINDEQAGDFSGWLKTICETIEIDGKKSLTKQAVMTLFNKDDTVFNQLFDEFKETYLSQE